MPTKAIAKTDKSSKKESSKKSKDPLDSASLKSADSMMDSGLEAGQPMVDLEELEEQEAEASAAASGGGNAAALAAASGSTEMSASFKNFRHHPDMENFYRFIYENDLRHEALAIIDDMMAEKLQRKFVKGAKAQPN
jgi:hypothetical protein